jgi:hypothetical protein
MLDTKKFCPANDQLQSSLAAPRRWRRGAPVWAVEKSPSDRRASMCGGPEFCSAPMGVFCPERATENSPGRSPGFTGRPKTFFTLKGCERRGRAPSGQKRAHAMTGRYPGLRLGLFSWTPSGSKTGSNDRRCATELTGHSRHTAADDSTADYLSPPPLSTSSGRGLGRAVFGGSQ